MAITFDVTDIAALAFDSNDTRVEDEMFEILVCALYREDRLSGPDVMKCLNLESRFEFWDIIAKHNAHQEWTDEDIAQEVATIDWFCKQSGLSRE